MSGDATPMVVRIRPAVMSIAVFRQLSASSALDRASTLHRIRPNA
jgi:hypothetical protein